MHVKIVRCITPKSEVRPDIVMLDSAAIQHSYVWILLAYPFAQPMEEAIRQVGVIASFYTLDLGLPKSILARYLPWLGTQPIRPTKTAAVYLPAWIIDAQITGMAVRHF